MRTYTVFLALALAASPTLAQNSHWVATWGTAQTLSVAGGRGGAPAARGAAAATAAAPVAAPATAGPQRRFPIPSRLASVTNQSICMIVRTSVAGSTVRVRLTNAIKAPTVRIGAAHVALRTEESKILPESDRVLTFSGKVGALTQFSKGEGNITTRVIASATCAPRSRRPLAR